MDWIDQQDKLSIYKQATGESEKRILDLAERIAGHIGSHGVELGLHDLSLSQVGALLSPDEIANSLVLVISYFQGGDLLYPYLSPLEQALVEYQTTLVLEYQAAAAAQASHKGEADESLVDSG